MKRTTSQHHPKNQIAYDIIFTLMPSTIGDIIQSVFLTIPTL